MDVLLGIFLLFAGLFFYFLPALIAGRKRNATAIFWLNFLAGWTFIGWIGALIWAMMKDEPTPKYYEPAPVANTSQDVGRIAKLKEMRDAGLLTQEEFMQQVSQL